MDRGQRVVHQFLRLAVGYLCPIPRIGRDLRLVGRGPGSAGEQQAEPGRGAPAGEGGRPGQGEAGPEGECAEGEAAGPEPEDLVPGLRAALPERLQMAREPGAGREDGWPRDFWSFPGEQSGYAALTRPTGLRPCPRA